MGDNIDPEEPIDNLEEVSRLKSQEGNNGHADSMSDDDKDLFTTSEDDKE